MYQQPRIGEETIPSGEAAQIAEIVALMREIQEARDAKQDPVPRNVHPKQHGCVRAELIVDSELSATLRQGIFREERSYPAFVRFSNAKQRDDRLPDGHGMAIKLLGVPGPKILGTDADTQDFVLIDHPVFFARDVADFLPLMHDFRRLLLGGASAKTWTVLKGLLSPNERFRLVRKAAAKRPNNPLEIQYWSTTPIRFGSTAAKFSLRPRIDRLPEAPANSPDKLRLAMAAHLRKQEARFDFLLQLQTNPQTMPVEDATVAWEDAEFTKVATLRIPQQSFESPDQIQFGENLSFTPWHALEDHRPLGGINRARLQIYEAMAARRRELNGAIQREPTLDDWRRVFGTSD
jgi:hypothetical protein